MGYVLIIDDDTDFSAAVCTVLESRGLQTATEPDYTKAMERIAARRPDAIILDVMFPENDTAGFEVARAIRREHGELPVFLLTGVNATFPLGFGNKDLDSKWLPAVELIEKPCDLKQLSEKVLARIPAK